MLNISDVRRDTGVNWHEEHPDTHDKFELSLLVYGKCLYRIEDRKLIAEKGDIVLIPPGAAYYGKSIPTVMHDKYAISFTLSGERNTAAQLPGLDSFRVWKPVRFDHMLHRIRQLHDEWGRQAAFYAPLCAAILQEQLALLCREGDMKHDASRKREQAEWMMGYVDNHYRERITKDTLGAYIGRSPNYTAALFREATGQTISGYVHAVRLKTAQSLLAQSRMTVAEVAEYVGYDDPSYFYRLFKKLWGKLPSDYAKQREESKL